MIIFSTSIQYQYIKIYFIYNQNIYIPTDENETVACCNDYFKKSGQTIYNFVFLKMRSLQRCKIHLFLP